MNIPYNIPWQPHGIFISHEKSWLRVWLCDTWCAALGCVIAVRQACSWLNDTAQAVNRLEPCDPPRHREVGALVQSILRVASCVLSY